MKGCGPGLALKIKGYLHKPIISLLSETCYHIEIYYCLWTVQPRSSERSRERFQAMTISSPIKIHVFLVFFQNSTIYCAEIDI